MRTINNSESKLVSGGDISFSYYNNRAVLIIPVEDCFDLSLNNQTLFIFGSGMVSEKHPNAGGILHNTRSGPVKLGNAIITLQKSWGDTAGYLITWD